MLIDTLQGAGGPLSPALAAATRLLVANDAATLARQLELVRVPSPTGGEGARGAVVARAFRELGWSTRVSAVGNVIASWNPHHSTQHTADTADSGAESTVAPVVCMAHLDTVFPHSTPLSPVAEGSRYICPGIGDNCRGLAGLLALARVISHAGDRAAAHTSAFLFARPLEFVASVGEEGLGNLRGAQDYFTECATRGAPAAHAVIVLDGPGDSSIVHHGLGSRRYHVTFRGRGGHSWADFGLPNAIHAAARATVALAELPRTLPQRVAVTVSRTGGGEFINAIPDAAWFDVDVRATDEHVLLHVDSELRRIVLAAARAESHDASFAQQLSVEVTLTGRRPTGTLGVEHPLVRAAQRATEQLGVSPVSAVASTDANVPLSRGIPAITIGAGGTGGSAHTLHEWYDNTNGVRGLSRALAIVAAMAA